MRYVCFRLITNIARKANLFRQLYMLKICCVYMYEETIDTERVNERYIYFRGFFPLKLSSFSHISYIRIHYTLELRYHGEYGFLTCCFG